MKIRKETRWRVKTGQGFETRHSDIKQTLCERIRSKQYRMMVPSSRSLAKEFGVNYKTVEKAVNTLVQEGLVYRKRGKGTFVALKKEQTRHRHVARDAVGVVVPDISIQSWIQGAVAGIQAAMERLGCDVILKAHRTDLGMERQAISTLVKGKVRGIIALPANTVEGDDNRKMFAKLRLPLVLIDRYFDDVGTHFVGVDNFQGAGEAVRHLVGLGHRRIGHVTGAPVQSAKDRLGGYRSALQLAGISFHDEWLWHFSENGTPAEAEAAWRHWMALSPRPTAIFAANDGMALQLFSTALRLGIRIPQDMSLIGFDDAPVMATLDLSSVVQPFEDIGRNAADLLWQVMEGRQREKVVHKIMPIRIVQRGSTAAPPHEINSANIPNLETIQV